MASKYYREDGGEWEVEVLSDSTDAEGMRRLKLRCVREITKCPLIRSLPPGEEWESAVKRGWESYVGWSLHEEPSS